MMRSLIVVTLVSTVAATAVAQVRVVRHRSIIRHV